MESKDAATKLPVIFIIGKQNKFPHRRVTARLPRADPREGAPGAGKGTLCKRLAQEHGLTHISVGDFLRQVTADADADDFIRDYVERGEPLPTDRLMPLLQARLRDCVSGRAVLLDGFPRRLEQAEGFERVVSWCDFRVGTRSVPNYYLRGTDSV